MYLSAFKKSLSGSTPPDKISSLLQAMWYDAKGDWKMAHQIAQEEETDNGAWVHAYLHRKEGDSSNAGYWYGRAGKSMPDMDMSEEWDRIVEKLLI